MEKLNLNAIKDLDVISMEKAKAYLDNLTKPIGSLGKLEDCAIRIAGIRRAPKSLLRRKVIFTMAGDHGVALEGVCTYPREVTQQMVYNFMSGGAAINVLARHSGCEVIVVDMGVAGEILASPIGGGDNSKLPALPADRNSKNFIDKKINFGTQSFLKGPAMSKNEAIDSINKGAEVFEDAFNEKPIDIVGTGDMGIGNTTPSSAIISVITGAKVSEVTGRGAGLSDESLRRKIEVIEKSIELNNPDKHDAIDILSKLGGFEIGGICGLILKAAEYSVPVVLDGFISTAAGLLAYKINPKVKDYMFSAHRSAEGGHRIALEYISLVPMLDLGMRLGEGTGSAIAIGVLDASLKILNEMATFESAGVSKANSEEVKAK